MKKLTYFLAAMLLALVIVGQCNAQTIVKQGQKITAADTVTHEVELNNTLFNPVQYITVYVDSANTGTIKFTVAPTSTPTPIKPASSFKSYGDGSRIIFAIDNGRYNLFYKASAANNSFTVTE